MAAPVAEVVAEKTYSTTNKLLAEVLGTFVLVFIVIGTALFSSSNTGYLGVALSIGLGVAAAAFAFGRVSGGHFNPAVSIGLAVAGKFAWKDLPGYVIAQFIGGAIASSLLYTIDSKVNFTAASNGYGELSANGVGLTGVIIAEVVLTALLLTVILGSTSAQAAPGFAPLAIGFTLSAIHLVAIPVSNASFNPARSLATAIFGGEVALAQLWVFFVAPIAGAILAGIIFRAVRGNR